MRVTEDEEAIIDDFEIEVERKLDYDYMHTIKLDFEPKSSSMKKKQNFGEQAQKSAFKAINLFQVSHQEEERQKEKGETTKVCFTP